MKSTPKVGHRLWGFTSTRLRFLFFVTISVTKRRFSALGNDSGYDSRKTLPLSLPNVIFRPRVTIPVTFFIFRYHFRNQEAFFGLG